MRTLQRVFDACIASDLPLPGPGSCDGESADWTITCPTGALDESAYPWFHSWKSDDGQVLMQSGRRGGDYLLRVFDRVSFLIRFGERRIEAYAPEGYPQNTIAHLLLDQVIPRVLCHQGRSVLHASSVLLRDGRAIAFSGPSGRGKSTLATAFHNAGHQVLADDCLLLQQKGESVLAISAYSSLRLWPDSLAALAGEASLQNEPVSEMAHYSRKKQLLFNTADESASASPVELSALFLLHEPGAGLPGEDVLITAASGSAALMGLIEASFALDVVDRNSIQRNFETVGQLANYLPVFGLSYQRDYNKLPQVIERVVKFRAS